MFPGLRPSSQAVSYTHLDVYKRQAEGMLRECIARGADRCVLISGREFGGSDTFATSQIIAAGVNKVGVGPEDIVLCGRQAIDGDTAQVGPQIAEKPVSYTHLDVYKRQVFASWPSPAT